jgi:chitinase
MAVRGNAGWLLTPILPRGSNRLIAPKSIATSTADFLTRIVQEPAEKAGGMIVDRVRFRLCRSNVLGNAAIVAPPRNARQIMSFQLAVRLVAAARICWIRWVAGAVLAAAMLVDLAPPNAAEPSFPVGEPFRIVAYLTDRADIPKIGAEKLTHINYAFAQVSEDGRIVLHDPQAPRRLAELRALKAKNPILKVILSVGGWGADHFSDAALTHDSRAKFAASAIELIQTHSLDGIDLDWEYPGQPGPGIKFREEDKQNFTLLLKELRRQMDQYDHQQGPRGDRHSILTIASADGDYFAHTEMDKLHEYLDWANIMAYDFYNSATKTAGHHAGLFAAGGAESTPYFAAHSVEQHLAAGIPAHKLTLGMAFYGHGWTGVNPENHGIQQPYERFAGDFPYTVLARDYIDKQGFERHWDDAAKAPYLWNPTTRTFISYDDSDSIREKLAFAKAKHLGGVMFWEYSHDPEEALLTTISKEAP